VPQLTVLGIDVSPTLLANWIDWLAPDVQPFFVTERQATDWDLPMDDREPTAEQRDTYRTYGVDSTAVLISWLDESSYLSLPKPTRARLVRAQVNHNRAAVPTVRQWQSVLGAPELRRQADGHRFVWWKSLLQDADLVLPRIVSEDLGPSRHSEVVDWPSERGRHLAGTFADGSGPNCFGTVMAAAGADGAEDVWMQRDPFERWLADNTVAGGRDDVPGTVFVWRDAAQAVQHAAITIGAGWMLHKPSQSWMTPRKIRTVAEVRRATRTAGWRLGRRSLKR
jgi:cell wall-associated NlpC family hydrolase